MKKLIKGAFLFLSLFFCFTFFNKNTEYYNQDSILTQEAIQEFEKDLKEGKKIQPSYYIQPKKDYNNQACKIGMKCSKAIEKVVNRLLQKLLNSIESS